ncbi:hypothetical protein Ahia01_000106500 [Argonauta hians]
MDSPSVDYLTLPPQHGRVAIVTGGTSGIGYYTVKTLCSLGMHVIIASQSKKNIRRAIECIKKEQPDAVVEGFEVDMGSIKSVHKFALEFKSRRLPLHILINNAGVMFVPYKKTEDGMERHIAVNYMGHLLLTILLLPVLNMSGTNQLFARVVNVSSSTHRVGNIDLSTFTSKGAKPTRYSPYASYAQSKLAIIMATYELARRLRDAKCFRVTINVLHPGVIDSDLHSNAGFPVPLIRTLFGRFYLTPEQGADTVLHVALSPDLEKQSGGYYENCTKVKSSVLSHSMQVQQAIWHTSCSVLGIDPHDLPTSRSHEMSGNNAGMPLSWHHDYMNSPYQFDASTSPNKETGISCITGPHNTIATFGMVEKNQATCEDFVVNIDQQCSLTPLHVPKLEINPSETAIEIPQDPQNLPMKDVSINITEESKPSLISSLSELKPLSDEVVDIELSYKNDEDSIPNIFVSHCDSRDYLENIPEEENENDCKNFMSTPTIGPQYLHPVETNTIVNSSSDDDGETQLRTVMCGNDIIYLPNTIEEAEAKSSPSSIRDFPKISSSSYIPMEEGLNSCDVTSNYSKDVSISANSSCLSIPCITLNESMLASLNYESDSLSEMENSEGQQYLRANSSFSSNEAIPDILPKKSVSTGTSPDHDVDKVTISKSFSGSAPNLKYQSKLNEVISDKNEHKENNSNKEQTKPEFCETSFIFSEILHKGNLGEKILSDDDDEYDPSSSAEDSSISEDFENIKLPLRYSSRTKYDRSPSVSDEEEFLLVRKERGRSMIRRCSQISQNNFPLSVSEDSDTEASLGSVTLKDITIKVPERRNSVSQEQSPHAICKYQDDQILKFVNDVITESIKLSAEDAELDQFLERIRNENTEDDDVDDKKILYDSKQMCSKESSSTLAEILQEKCLKDVTDGSSKDSEISENTNDLEECGSTVDSEATLVNDRDKDLEKVEEGSIDADEEVRITTEDVAPHTSYSPPKFINLKHTNVSPAFSNKDPEIEIEFLDKVESEIKTSIFEKGSGATNIPYNLGNKKTNPDFKFDAFSQKGWDRLPYNASEAEMNAFRNYAAFTESLKRAGGVIPLPQRLDPVLEEVNVENIPPIYAKNYEEVDNVDVTRTSARSSPEPEPDIIKDCALFADAFLTDDKYLAAQSSELPLNKPPDSPVKRISKQFEELAGHQSPLCPQNSPESSSRPSSPHPQSFFPSNSMTESSFEEEEDEMQTNRVIFSPLSSPLKRIDEDVDSMGFLFLIPQNKYPKAKIVSVPDNVDPNLETVKGVLIEEDNDVGSLKLPSMPFENCSNRLPNNSIPNVIEDLSNTQSESPMSESNCQNPTQVETDIQVSSPTNKQDLIAKIETFEEEMMPTKQWLEPIEDDVQNIIPSDESPLQESGTDDTVCREISNASNLEQNTTENNLTQQTDISIEDLPCEKDSHENSQAQKVQHTIPRENITDCDNESNSESEGLSDPLLEMILAEDSSSENLPMSYEVSKDIEYDVFAGMSADEQMSPSHNAETGAGVELTDNSEMSTASYYSQARSSIDSEDCWFDSKSLSLDLEHSKNDSDYAKMLASYYAVSKEES